MLTFFGYLICLLDKYHYWSLHRSSQFSKRFDSSLRKKYQVFGEQQEEDSQQHQQLFGEQQQEENSQQLQQEVNTHEHEHPEIMSESERIRNIQNVIRIMKRFDELARITYAEIYGPDAPYNQVH